MFAGFFGPRKNFGPETTLETDQFHEVPSSNNDCKLRVSAYFRKLRTSDKYFADPEKYQIRYKRRQEELLPDKIPVNRRKCLIIEDQFRTMV